jgi:hypothetical protein
MESIMGKRDILKNLLKGSLNEQRRDTYRRFLLENFKTKSWDRTVRELALWLNHDNLFDVEEALIDYLANDDITAQQLI